MSKMLFEKKKSDSENTIEELRNRTFPVYIYGQDSMASRVYECLKENGICVSGFFVDEGYKRDKEKYGLPVYLFSYVMQQKEADVVIGFYRFGLAYKMIEEKKITNNGKVFFINQVPLFDYAYYEQNAEGFTQTWNYLEDDLSRQTMKAYMDGKMNGVMKPLYECFVPNQYFIPEVTLGAQEVYIDCGMYDGDTITEFIKRCENYRQIIGFEPDEKNIAKFRERNLQGNITVIPKGAWSEERELCFLADGTSSKFTEQGEEKIAVTSIDALKLEYPVTFIKMDIEGSELEALKGARETIQKYMPKLAICVYHKKEDMLTIPQYIKSLETQGRHYHFLLRHHSLCEHETVLYAIPESEDRTI